MISIEEIREVIENDKKLKNNGKLMIQDNQDIIKENCQIIENDKKLENKEILMNEENKNFQPIQNFQVEIENINENSNLEKIYADIKNNSILNPNELDQEFDFIEHGSSSFKNH